MKLGFMDRAINTIEWAAAAFIGIVAADIFIAVVLRKFFNTSIPDSYDFGKLLLGTLIFWGIAATSYRGTHITVDLLWSSVNLRWKRFIDVFATLVLLFVVAVHTYTIFDKVRGTPGSPGTTSPKGAVGKALDCSPGMSVSNLFWASYHGVSYSQRRP